MNEFQGLMAAEVFLLAAAAIGGACEMFNRRGIAAVAMLCVLMGFTGVVFTRHYHAERYMASDEPKETYYHVAKVVDGHLASDCIHAPTSGHVRPFSTESEARATGRIPCRCVRQDGLPTVSLPVSVAVRQSAP